MARYKWSVSTKLPHKRQANAHMESVVTSHVKSIGPKKYRAFILPSINMHDIKFLRKNRVSHKNMVCCERDPSSWQYIRQSAKTDIGNRPMPLQARVRGLSMAMSQRFNYVNIDSCSPICDPLQQSIHDICKRLDTRGAVLAITIMAARENSNTRHFLNCNYFGFSLKDQRILWMKDALAIPRIYGFRTRIVEIVSYADSTPMLFGYSLCNRKVTKRR